MSLPPRANLSYRRHQQQRQRPGSLRAAIADVCVGGTVTFAPRVAGPINLTSGELVVKRPVTTIGPGANLLTVQRSISASTTPASSTSTRAELSYSGLTVTKGNPNNNGGGFYVDNGSILTLKAAQSPATPIGTALPSQKAGFLQLIWDGSQYYRQHYLRQHLYRRWRYFDVGWHVNHSTFHHIR